MEGETLDIDHCLFSFYKKNKNSEGSSEVPPVTIPRMVQIQIAREGERVCVYDPDSNLFDVVERAIVSSKMRPSDVSRCAGCDKIRRADDAFCIVHFDNTSLRSYRRYAEEMPLDVDKCWPPAFGFTNNRYVMEGDVLCRRCSDAIDFRDWDDEEHHLVRLFCERAFFARGETPACFRFPDISQNNLEWMKKRFGPDLMRLGSSAAGAALGLSQYAGRLALASSFLGFHPLDGYAVSWRVRLGSTKTRYTEFGHRYEDFVTALFTLLYPDFVVEEGGIRIPAAAGRERLRYAVSTDGDIFARNDAQRRVLLGVFEAKSAYHTSHHESAYKEAADSYKRNHEWVNPNAHHGIKAEHMAQVQIQMAVSGAPMCIYCTVQWVRWVPPHPVHGIPPLQSVRMIQVPSSYAYWNEYAEPKLREFTNALRGWDGAEFSTTERADWRESPPFVEGVVDMLSNAPDTAPVPPNGGIIRTTRALENFEKIMSDLHAWAAEHKESAEAARVRIETEWDALESKGIEPEFKEWW